MAQRVHTTILLITRQTLVRADLSRGPKRQLLGLWQQPRPDLRDLPALAEAALLLGPKPGRRVWVLSTDLWIQTLELPVQKTTGLSESELAGALNFEIEALSGLSSFEAAAGYVSLERVQGQQHFWMVQARASDIEQLDNMVAGGGSKLMGVGHPGGVCQQPLLLEGNGRRSWQRVELWPDAVVALASPALGAALGPRLDSPAVQVFTADPQMGRWKADIADWRRGQSEPEHSEMLVAFGIAGPADSQKEQIVNLEDNEQFALWLFAAAEQLERKQPIVPLLRPGPHTWSQAQLRRLAAGLAVASLALCVLIFWVWSWRIRTTQAETAILQEPARRLPELQKQLSESEKQRTELKQETDRLKRGLARLANQRERPARLLALLAEHAPEELLIQKIDSNDGEPHIRGVCLRPELADQLASALAERLRPYGWEVQAHRKQAKEHRSDGAPWEFDIAMKSPPEMEPKKSATVYTSSTTPAVNP